MKNIKEAANEYAKDYLFSTLPQRAPNIHFEAGANYVLEVVESILEDKELNCEETYDKIYATIKQLKK